MKITPKQAKKLKVCPARYRAVMKELGNPDKDEAVDMAEILEAGEAADIAWLASALDDFGRAGDLKDAVLVLGSDTRRALKATEKIDKKAAKDSLRKALSKLK